jgi:hypothetical protein
MMTADTPAGQPTRPDLQRLLDDVRARKIDVIVVYKVDRLTRSLADFAKLVELFDTHGVSFVSVTQQFNTLDRMRQSDRDRPGRSGGRPDIGLQRLPNAGDGRLLDYKVLSCGLGHGCHSILDGGTLKTESAARLLKKSKPLMEPKGSVTDAEQIASRERCSVRHVSVRF